MTAAQVYLVVLGNVIVATAYFAVAAFVIPKFNIVATRFAVRFLQGLALLFFTLCAATHLDIAYHAHFDRPAWMANPHFLVQHFVQGLAGWGFVFLAARYLTINITQVEKEEAA